AILEAEETMPLTDERTELPARPRTCGSCRHWDVRIRRTRALEESVARCLLPQHAPVRLIVSGSSGCDAWDPVEAVSDQPSAVS
ncbi:MAG TPA: hypothetical protein VGM37_21325, partial [Armatimonadota bacterium]